MGAVSKGSTGYNGWTGAPAQWDEGKGMWIDSSGAEIRDDAITAAPAASAPPPPEAVAPAPEAAAVPIESSFALPTAPAATTPTPDAAQPAGGAMSALAQASSGPGYQEGSAGALNTSLGSRLMPNSLRALATLAGRNY